ncbi:acriflavin resistance protein [candidate division LCP-89 bacterium B3_LCP]|uniref:Acriflavin resistance protein n=1 Tax=candidate division LCP-89 bacterium B3_LCP TaxID=2012998 RepID=A0A532V0G4_UNCL8|nr:MAG: acriflavin resistance protein [candidate division LCP-89 bacterium B3_LCP]
MESSPEKRTFSNAFEIATRRPVAVLMIFLAIVVFGSLSYKQLALNLMPEISYPTLTVRTEYPGSAPEEVETAISRPLEQALGVVNGLVTISSVSQSDLSDIIIEYRWDTNMDQAVQEVREKIDQVFLPEDANRPLILRYDPTLDPILRLGLHGGADLFDLRYLADEDLKRALEKIPGVAAVKVKGGYEEEIRVNVSEKQLVSLGLSLEQINARLYQENINIAGGNLKDGDTEYVVRTLNEFTNIQEISDLVVTYQGSVPIRLKDFAVVEPTYKDREVITRVNGQESVEIAIFKEADANLVAVSQAVRQEIFGTLQEQERWEAHKKAKEKKAEKKPDDKKTDKGEKKKKGRRDSGAPPVRYTPEFMAAALPPGMEIELLSDQSTFVEASIREVRNTAMIGGILAILVLYFFLRNLVTTLIIGTAIPISVVATFAPMHLSNVTLNIMSLGGLALGIGMLVDNSIVVLESIFRCKQEGDSILQAAVRGTGEVGSAVVASTLTTIAVFFPIVFVEGVAGQVFGDMALTVVFSLLASLVVALYFIPMLASRDISAIKQRVSELEAKSGKGKKLLSFSFWPRLIAGFSGLWRWWKRGKWIIRLLKVPLAVVPGLIYILLRGTIELLLNIFQKLLMITIVIAVFAGRILSKLFAWTLKHIMKPLLNGFDFVYQKLADVYPRILETSVQNPGRVLGGALLLFLLCFGLLLPRLGKELIPEVSQGEFNIDMTYPVGTSVETTAQRSFPLERSALELSDVDRVSLAAGVERTSFSTAEEGEHTSKVTVRLRPGGDLQAKEEVVINRLRRDMSQIPEVETKISHPTLFSYRTPVEVEIRGYNLRELGELSESIEGIMHQIPGVVDVNSTFAMGNPEIQVVYNRERVASLGLNVQQIARLVRHKVLGEVATEFREKDRRIDIRVRVKDQDRSDVEDLQRLVVNPGGSQPIKLASVADVIRDRGPARIWRVDQQRAAKVSANVSGRDLGSVVDDLKVELSKLVLPSNIDLAVTGQNREMEESLGSLTFALILAIFLVYIVMASQFESLLHPFIILFTVPLAGIGVILLLWIMGISLSIVVYLGMIMLTGIVVNNAIVLVDYINRLRRRGLKMKEAIITAGKVRMRPILMTTTTTVLALIPMSLGLGEGAEIRTPMALTVIAGLISSTVLTLIVIPTVYALVSREKPVDESQEVSV